MAHEFKLECPKCKSDLYLVLETVTETPYKLLGGSKIGGEFKVEQVYSPKTTPSRSVKVFCLVCRSRFYSIEYGKLIKEDMFKFDNPHTHYLNFDTLHVSTAVEIPNCFLGHFFKLCERPRNVKRDAQSN